MSDEPQSPAPHSREEAIAPIRRGPAGEPRAVAPDAGRRRVPATAVVGVTLVVLLLGVFFALPRWIAPDEDPAGGPETAGAAGERAPAGEPVAPPEPTLSPEALAALRSEAEAALADVLELNDRLQARSADVWGGENYLAFDAISREGDDAFLADDFVTANERYGAALELGRALIDQSDDIMSAALDAGDAAIAAGNPALAAEQYGLVLTVDPDNGRARDGVARADKLPDVLAGMREADRLRQAGELEAARDGYRDVLALDGAWTAAERALADVTATIAEARFDRQLSTGYAALADEDYGAAVEAFTAALALRPQSDAAREGFAQAEQGQKLDAIALAEIRALAFERRELWDQAIDRYTAALETDATLAFATEGLRRARMRSDLDSKLENLIANPRLLLDDEILTDAREVLDEARAYADTGERIAAQTARLAALIDAAASPVTVQLQSDEHTEVTVYRVGSLGAFAQKEIEVRPGTYTVVGSRSGYRDVRQTFTVLPGRRLDPVRVVCVEPI